MGMVLLCWEGWGTLSFRGWPASGCGWQPQYLPHPPTGSPPPGPGVTLMPGDHPEGLPAPEAYGCPSWLRAPQQTEAEPPVA